MEAAAARFPVELFDRILDFIARPHTRELIREYRRELAQCALTCRQFASRCQPWLFYRIRITSGERARRLVALLKAADTRIGGHIRFLEVVEADQGVPWIYLVRTHIIPLLPVAVRTTLRVQIRLRSSLTNHAPREYSLNPPASLSLPPSGNLIHSLDLWQTRFRTFSALVSLVFSLPFLQEIYCDTVTCEMDDIARWRRRPRRSHLRMARCTGCSFHWELLWLFVGVQGGEPYEAIHLCRAMQSIERGVRHYVIDVDKPGTIESKHSAFYAFPTDTYTGEYSLLMRARNALT